MNNAIRAALCVATVAIAAPAAAQATDIRIDTQDQDSGEIRVLTRPASDAAAREAYLADPCPVPTDLYVFGRCLTETNGKIVVPADIYSRYLTDETAGRRTWIEERTLPSGDPFDIIQEGGCIVSGFPPAWRR